MASGQCSCLDNLPGYAVWLGKGQKKNGNVEAVMSGKMIMMNILCQALTPKVTPPEQRVVGLSPMRSTYRIAGNFRMVLIFVYFA